MLVLTRKRNEMIQIGEQVVIKVIQLDKGTVRIGIHAPDDVRVLRAELCPALTAEALASESHRRREPVDVQTVA